MRQSLNEVAWAKQMGFSTTFDLISFDRGTTSDLLSLSGTLGISFESKINEYYLEIKKKVRETNREKEKSEIFVVIEKSGFMKCVN